MNPFNPSKHFNSKLYDSISKINKSSDKKVVEGLNELIIMEDDEEIFDCVMIKDALLKHFRSTNIHVRRLCSDLLLKIIKHKDDNLENVLAVWFLKFVEDQTYNSDVIICKEHFNFNKIIPSILNILDWENNLTISLKIFIMALKRNKDNKLNEYHKYFLTKLDYLQYNSNVILKYIYIVLEYIGPIEEVYKKIDQISTPVLIQTKSIILLKIYKKLSKCINRDIEFLENSILEEVLEKCQADKIQFDFDKLKPKNIESFKILLRFCPCKLTFFKLNYKRLNFDNLCVYNIVDDFKDIDNNFSESKHILENVIQSHNLTNDEFKDLEEYINNFKIFKGINKSSHSTLITVCDCKKSSLFIYKNLVDTIIDLNDIDKIERAYQLNLVLNRQFFKKETILNLKLSPYVFDKEDLQDIEFLPLLIKKYPDDYTDKDLKKVLTVDNFTDFLKIKKFTQAVKKWLLKQNVKNLTIESYRNIALQDYDLLFYYYGMIDFIRYINYNELCNLYLDCIYNIVEMDIFDLNEFSNEIIKTLGTYQILITVEYNDLYYCDIPHFYKDIQLIRPKNTKIRFIRDFYKQYMKSDVDKLIYLVCNAILNESSSTVYIKEVKHIDLKENNYFLYKVYKDLNVNYKEPFNRNNKLIDLLEEEIDIVYISNSHENDKNKSFNDDLSVDSLKLSNDHTILNMKENNICASDSSQMSKVIQSIYEVTLNNPKVIDQKILRGKKLAVKDTSVLSDKALVMFIENLKNNFDVYACLDYIENDIPLLTSSDRLKCFLPLFDLITNHFANTIINNFSISQVDEVISDDELYNFLISCIPKRMDLYKILLPDTLMKIRNLNIQFFFGKILAKRHALDFNTLFVESSISYRKKWIFLFPNLFIKYNKLNKKKSTKNVQVNISDLLIAETKKFIKDVECKVIKKSSGLQIIINYLLDNNNFQCEIFYPTAYPLQSPIFLTNVEKKSLLNLKISEMLNRTSKFMEVISLWKVNVDQKVLGGKECYICYFILHLQDGSFPNYVCLHCENKYHTKCVKKWIEEYRKTNCPLCRKILPLY